MSRTRFAVILLLRQFPDLCRVHYAASDRWCRVASRRWSRWTPCPTTTATPSRRPSRAQPTPAGHSPGTKVLELLYHCQMVTSGTSPMPSAEAERKIKALRSTASSCYRGLFISIRYPVFALLAYLIASFLLLVVRLVVVLIHCFIIMFEADTNNGWQ